MRPDDMAIPLWWFSVPGILKGWVDRVFAMGRFYGQGKVYENGVFAGKKAILSLTTGGAEDTYRKDGLHGDINAILRHTYTGACFNSQASAYCVHTLFTALHDKPTFSVRKNWNGGVKGYKQYSMKLLN